MESVMADRVVRVEPRRVGPDLGTAARAV